jgi:hypothetical protein
MISAQPGGYSKTPLIKKLGYKAGFRIRIKNAPDSFLTLLGELPGNIQISSSLRNNLDIDHLFVTSQKALQQQLPKSIQSIKQNGMIWVSWPKKSSGIKTDVGEDQIRDIALPLGIVDIKVCAIDEIWSGLKLVIRKELRKPE